MPNPNVSKILDHAISTKFYENSLQVVGGRW